LIAVLVIGAVALLGYEITTWHNALGIRKLVLPAALLGGAIGFWIGHRYGQQFSDPIDRLRIRLMGLCGGLILFIALSSFFNRTFAGPPQQVPATFVKLEMYGASRFGALQDSMAVDGYYLYFERTPQFGTERIRLKFPYPGPPQEGDQIFLPIREGLFGIEIVDYR
jgi:hypothetical protein